MNRRFFLRGLASSLALPAFESFGQVSTKQAAPTRLAFVYAPNGVNLKHWRPQGVGRNYKLNNSLLPLSKLRDQFQIIGGLDHDKAKANGDGPGDHARANATFLTGCQAKKTAGEDIQLGVSVDQIAAEAIGKDTRIPSLELSTDPPRRSGRCDSGYSCAYQYNLSWKNATTPMPPERHPRKIFEKLFGSGNAKEDAKRRHYQKSILDFVQQDAKSIQNKLDYSERDKLDAYLTAVRELEQQIENAERFAAQQPKADTIPAGIPRSYKQHIRLMYDMMALAYQTDSTRIATFMLAHDGSNRSFPELGVRDGHHSISHHRNNGAKLTNIAKIDKFYIEQFAYFLEKLKTTPDGPIGSGKNLLDHSMIVYGGGIADGNRHNHDNLPLILAGKGGGLKPGQHLIAKQGTPMTNLHLALLEKMGVNAKRIGDSTGKLGLI